VQYRKVTPGPIIDGWRVIRDGIQPDDWVIVKGVQRAKTGAKVDPIKQDSVGSQPSPPAAPERTVQKSNAGR
jgi:membrane fusion protein, multidrug efflux system